MIIRVREVRDEESDGDAARRGTGEGQTLYQKCDPAWPSRLARPYPGEAGSQGSTPPRLLSRRVCAPAGGPRGDANEPKGATHHADVHRQELEPAWHQLGVDIRRSCHRAESG